MAANDGNGRSGLQPGRRWTSAGVRNPLPKLTVVAVAPAEEPPVEPVVLALPDLFMDRSLGRVQVPQLRLRETGWYRVIRGLVIGSLISVGSATANAAAGQAASAQMAGESGYAYICDGPVQVQVVKEHPGDVVVIVDSVERPNSPNAMFEVFQASRPEECAAMAAPLSGAVPGTVLVAVTWAPPLISIVRPSVREAPGHCTGTGLPGSEGRR